MKRDGKERIDQCLNCTVADCQGICRGRLYEIDGVKDTYRGWARRCGISHNTVYSRLRAGIPIKQALKKCDNRPKKLYEIDGVTDHVEGWARRKGVNPQTVRRRVEKGITLEEALEMPVQRHAYAPRRSKIFLTARGRTLNLNQWAALLGVRRMALYVRLRHHGFDMEEAVAYYEKKTGVVIDAQASGAFAGGGDQSGTV